MGFSGVPDKGNGKGKELRNEGHLSAKHGIPASDDQSRRDGIAIRVRELLKYMRCRLHRRLVTQLLPTLDVQFLML